MGLGYEISVKFVNNEARYNFISFSCYAGTLKT